ncbi:MAG: hypothetical protein WD605_00610 [Candidatus Paceibacterota bacterium]
MSQLPKMPIINPVKREPFDDPTGDWTFDFKYDGFRGVLYKGEEHAWFRSKQDVVMVRFGGLAREVASLLKAKEAIVDGEIVVLDMDGRPIFNDILRKRSMLTYIAFDLLWLDGEDIRPLPLKERRRRLARILPQKSTRVLPAFTAQNQGQAMYDFMCKHDLEGLVAKRLGDPYNKRVKWYKIKNPNYSQEVGRQEGFNRRRQ